MWDEPYDSWRVLTRFPQEKKPHEGTEAGHAHGAKEKMKDAGHETK